MGMQASPSMPALLARSEICMAASGANMAIHALNDTWSSMAYGRRLEDITTALMPLRRRHAADAMKSRVRNSPVANVVSA